MEVQRDLGRKNFQTLTTRTLVIKGLIHSKEILERQQEWISACFHKAEWSGLLVMSKVDPLAIKTLVAEPLWPVQHPDTLRNLTQYGTERLAVSLHCVSFLYQNYAVLSYFWLKKAL